MCWLDRLHISEHEQSLWAPIMLLIRCYKDSYFPQDVDKYTGYEKILERSGFGRLCITGYFLSHGMTVVFFTSASGSTFAVMSCVTKISGLVSSLMTNRIYAATLFFYERFVFLVDAFDRFIAMLLFM